MLRSAPPHPPPRRKPRGPPLPSPRGSRPWRRPPPPHKKRQAGPGGPAYRDVRNALLALVRHGPAGALGPAGGPVGLSFAWPGSQPVPLPAGAVTKAREGRREGWRLSARGSPRARCPGCSARPPPPPPPLRLPAPPGSVRRAGGGGRGEGGRRGLQTDSSSRRRGAEPDSPLSARTRKLFPSDPPPTPPPAPRPPNGPALPTPALRARPRLSPGLALAIGKVWFSGCFKCRRRPRAAPAKPAAAPQVCGPAFAGHDRTAAQGGERGAGAEDPPELREHSGGPPEPAQRLPPPSSASPAAASVPVGPSAVHSP